MSPTHFGTLDAYRPTPPKTNPFADATRSGSPLSKRGAMNPRDNAISTFTAAWMEGLPQALRPTRLCAGFPRIANRAALCWADPTLLHRFFKSVLADQRGGRKGFPPDVAAELTRLQHFASNGMRCNGT